MKTLIKYTLLLVGLTLIGLVVYQNLDYFMTKNTLTLTIDKINWHWTSPALQNVFYFGLCFLAGLFLCGMKGLIVKWVLEEKLEDKEKEIHQRDRKIEDLKAELDFFTHDPYIKKGLEEQKKHVGQTVLAQSTLTESYLDEPEPPTDNIDGDQPDKDQIRQDQTENDQNPKGPTQETAN